MCGRLCVRVSLWVDVSFKLSSKADCGDRVSDLAVMVNWGRQLTPTVKLLFTNGNSPVQMVEISTSSFLLMHVRWMLI